MIAANLQIEGLCMAQAALQRLLIAKGLVTPMEIEEALHTAEATFIGEERSREDLNPSNRDAAVFALRFLRLAARQPLEAPLSFPELTAAVGRTKKPYGDQM